MSSSGISLKNIVLMLIVFIYFSPFKFLLIDVVKKGVIVVSMKAISYKAKINSKKLDSFFSDKIEEKKKEE